MKIVSKYNENRFQFGGGFLFVAVFQFVNKKNEFHSVIG